MEEESVSLLIDYILGLSDIFDFDTERLFELRRK